MQKRADQRAILAVTEVARTLPIMGRHALGEHCSRVRELEFKIAIVSPKGRDKFFENVAGKRGVQVSVVRDHGAAIEWLKQSATIISKAAQGTNQPMLSFGE